jgi:tRNA A-37 threonylcarbamoyl transferase component Bud32
MDEPQKKTRHWRESLDPDSAARIVARISQSEHARDPIAENGSEVRDDRALPGINGYEIHQLLGRGASGRVYLAVRRGSDRPVAIKLYSSRFDAGPHAQRATRELDLLSEIRHPNVVRVLDYGVHDASLWIATEFVDAAALDDYCTGHALTTKQRVKLLARVCDAVQGLHEFGVIHRDLKPSNILIDDNVQPTIIDLGIASLMGEDASATLTQEGTPIGTPAFMAPEQARGERAAISTRSDVYSLGAIGYLLLTGDTPHAGDATIHELIRRVAQDEPRDARAIEPAIPRGLAAVLGKAVTRSPAGRYASAAQLGADLRRWLAGEHVEAVRPGPWRKATRWIGRHPILTSSLVSAVFSLGIVGGVTTVVWQMNRVPAEIRILESGRMAILYAKSGRPLYEWRSGQDEGIMIARIVDRPKEFGGGKAILTVIRGFEGNAELDQQLCLWEINEPGELIWSTRAMPPFVKAPGGELPTLTSTDFIESVESYVVGEFILIEDVFADNPGDEIVVVHSHHSVDPQAIRVYDMAGKVLYEAWHWGSVRNLYWIENPGVLVCRGMNNEVPWPDRGYPEVNLRFPIVLFALKPESGQQLGWINGPSADKRVDLRWYKFLSPPEATDQYDLGLSIPSVLRLRDSCVLITLNVKGTDARVSLTLDSKGEPALSLPLENDPYKKLEDPPTWEFVDEIPAPPGGAATDEREPETGGG